MCVFFLSFRVVCVDFLLYFLWNYGFCRDTQFTTNKYWSRHVTTQRAYNSTTQKLVKVSIAVRSFVRMRVTITTWFPQNGFSHFMSSTINCISFDLCVSVSLPYYYYGGNGGITICRVALCCTINLFAIQTLAINWNKRTEWYRMLLVNQLSSLRQRQQISFHHKVNAYSISSRHAILAHRNTRAQTRTHCGLQSALSIYLAAAETHQIYSKEERKKAAAKWLFFSSAELWCFFLCFCSLTFLTLPGCTGVKYGVYGRYLLLL